jgi:palmitoyltransferase
MIKDIREHAILCIRNMLEGNPQNQKIVEELDAVQTVPSEVLDKSGYEHFIDESGRVQLRKLPERKM